MRIMALDIGDRRIGVAVSDPLGLIARPLAIIRRRGEAADAEAVKKLVDENEISLLVVGLPYSLNGSIGPQAKLVQQFAFRLEKEVPVPVLMKDERFSTKTVAEHRKESGAGRKKRRELDDAEASAVILQDYLNELKPS
jgi:putative Holliday junction resolvase